MRLQFSELSLRLNSMPVRHCPCSLALAEMKGIYWLDYELDGIIEELGLRDESIAIRSTGCPNGCGRPYLGEIGLVRPRKYNLYLGAGLDGMRLNKLYRPAIPHEEIISEFTPCLRISQSIGSKVRHLVTFVFAKNMSRKLDKVLIFMIDDLGKSVPCTQKIFKALGKKTHSNPDCGISH